MKLLYARLVYVWRTLQYAFRNLDATSWEKRRDLESAIMYARWNVEKMQGVTLEREAAEGRAWCVARGIGD